VHIPVFVSAPTTLSIPDETVRDAFMRQLDALGLEPRALGLSDYPAANPLSEVTDLARRCSGALILGFGQFTAATGLMNAGTSKETKVKKVVMPTPWNQLEGGLVAGLGLPLLVFRSAGVSGGMFDPGVGDYFVQNMPITSDAVAAGPVVEVLRKWAGAVHRFT
jgi:hypothetical protein